MATITNHMPTKELQALDAAHHMHPFTTGDDLAAKGARVITRASGVMLTDSEGNEILDAMALRDITEEHGVDVALQQAHAFGCQIGASRLREAADRQVLVHPGEPRRLFCGGHQGRRLRQRRGTETGELTEAERRDHGQRGRAGRLRRLRCLRG